MIAVHPSLIELSGYVLSCGHVRPSNRQSYKGSDGHRRTVCRECERTRKREAHARRIERTRVGGRSSATITRRQLEAERPRPGSNTERALRLLPVFQEPEPDAIARPRCRAECADVPRPCPFVGCKFHLYLDVSKRGSIRLNFPELEPDQMPADASCALDVADQGGISGERLAMMLNVSREGIRQMELGAFEKLQRSAAALRDAIEES
jgi:hypothetical protein